MHIKMRANEKFSHKRAEERREKFRRDETYRLCFQVVGNRVKPPPRHSSRFMGARGDGLPAAGAPSRSWLQALLPSRSSAGAPSRCKLHRRRGLPRELHHGRKLHRRRSLPRELRRGHGRGLHHRRRRRARPTARSVSPRPRCPRRLRRRPLAWSSPRTTAGLLRVRRPRAWPSLLGAFAATEPAGLGFCRARPPRRSPPGASASLRNPPSRARCRRLAKSFVAGPRNPPAAKSRSAGPLRSRRPWTLALDTGKAVDISSAAERGCSSSGSGGNTMTWEPQVY